MAMCSGGAKAKRSLRRTRPFQDQNQRAPRAQSQGVPKCRPFALHTRGKREGVGLGRGQEKEKEKSKGSMPTKEEVGSGCGEEN